MKFSLKTYKYFKSKHYFKTTNYFFFLQGISLNDRNIIEIKQNLINHDLKSFKIFNKITIHILKNSIFKNLIVLVRGPIILLYTNHNKNLMFETLKTIHPLINVLGLKLNNKIYSKKQIENLKNTSYRTNILTFHNNIRTWMQSFYYGLKKKASK